MRGWAAGIGLNLALAADFTVAADDARFWAPFVDRGFTPDSGATWLLPRRDRRRSAPREMLDARSRVVDGAEAAEWGMIHRAVPAAELDAARGRGWSPRWRRAPTVALGLTKWLLHIGRDDAARRAPRATRRSRWSCRPAATTSAKGCARVRREAIPEFGGR